MIAYFGVVVTWYTLKQMGKVRREVAMKHTILVAEKTKGQYSPSRMQIDKETR